MILSFMTKWGKAMPQHLAGMPTYFVEKITEGLLRNKSVILQDADWKPYTAYKPVANYRIGDKREKVTTIRQDKWNRWRTGMDIHFFINSRRPDMFRFAPVTKCISTQKIHIDHTLGFVQVFIDGKWFGDVFHHGLDDIYEYTTDLEKLAINDGFESVDDFFAWFSKDFTGKIIHWTDLKY